MCLLVHDSSDFLLSTTLKVVSLKINKKPEKKQRIINKKPEKNKPTDYKQKISTCTVHKVEEGIDLLSHYLFLKLRDQEFVQAFPVVESSC